MTTLMSMNFHVQKAADEHPATGPVVSAEGKNKPSGRQSSLPGKNNVKAAARRSSPDLTSPQKKKSFATESLGLTPNGKRQVPIVSLDNIGEAPRIKGVLNSPRSLKACQLEGITPDELLPRVFEEFMGPSVPENLARMRFSYYDNRRKEKMQRACAARDKLPIEQKVEKDEKDEKGENGENGKAHSDSPVVKSVNYKKKMCLPPRPSMGNSIKSRQSCGHHSDVPMGFSHLSRCSSLPMRHSARTRSTSPSEMRSCRTRDNHCPSVGALRIYDRVVTENRLPSYSEIDYLENDGERELRSLGALERKKLEEKIRERILVDKELKKSRHMLQKLVEKEVQKSLKFRSRQLDWMEKMSRIHEKQERETEARREHIESEIKRRESVHNHFFEMHSSTSFSKRKSPSPEITRSRSLRESS